MKSIMLILSAPLRKFFPKRTKNHNALKKRYLSLEKGKLNKKIDSALNLKDYSSALSLIDEMNRVEKKLNRVERKKINQ